MNSRIGCQSNQRGDYDDKGREKDAIGAIGGGTGAQEKARL